MFENQRCKGSCGETFPLTEEHFCFRKSSVNGKRYPSRTCRACERKKARENRRAKWADPAGKKRIQAQNKAFRSKPDRMVVEKVRNHEKYLANADKIQARVKAYRQVPKNKARRNALWRKRYALERDERRATFKKRYHADPEFRLRGNIRARVWEALRAAGGVKDSSILTALPYELEELKWHIESQFEDGMGWDVPKSFSIDHIIPQSMFSYTSLEDPEFRLCWSLDNLRPMRPSDNFAEGNRSGLFSGHPSFSDLVAWLRDSSRGSDSEDVGFVRDGLRMCRLEGDRCSLTHHGLGLLDSAFPHRFDARSRGKLSLNEAYADDSLALKVLAYIVRTGRPVTARLFYRNMAYVCRTPAHFFPSAAASVVREYADGGRVLDPFLGWGGRTLGAICGGAKSIHGCDRQPASSYACKGLVASVRPETEVEFVNADFRKWLPTLRDGFDLLLTSPPFADSEDYGSGEMSNVSEWSSRIMEPLARLSRPLIHKGGVVAIHCQDRRGFPMLSLTVTAMEAEGFRYVRTLDYGSRQFVLIFS